MIIKKLKKEFKFFKNLPEQDLLDFLAFCESREVPEGETVWQEGDDDNYAAFIISGVIGIKKKTKFEGKYMIVGTFGKGSVTGELCLLTDNLRSVTAVAIKPVKLLILNSSNFEHLLTRNPLLGLRLLKKIFTIATKRLNQSYDRISSIF